MSAKSSSSLESDLLMVDDSLPRSKHRRFSSCQPFPSSRCRTSEIFEQTMDVYRYFNAEVLRDVGVFGLPRGSSDDSEEETSTINTTAMNTSSFLVDKLQSVDRRGDQSFLPNIDVVANSGNAENDAPFSIRRRARTEAFTGNDYFACISDEVILYIFGWLSKNSLGRCARVCKRWQQLAYDESLWKAVDLSGRNLAPGELGHVIRRGVTILQLAKADVGYPIAVSWSLSSSNSLMQDNLNVCKLQHLDLSMAIIAPEGIGELLAVCDRLQNLSLEYCTVSDAVCCHIGQNNGLRQLNLAMALGLTRKGIQSICGGCKSLVALNLAWTHLSLKTMDVVIRNLPKDLIKLNVSGCRSTLCDGMIHRLVHRCPSLTELDLSDAVQLTGRSLESITDHLCSLRCLALSRCTSIRAVHYELLRDLECLTNLDAFGLFNNTGIQWLQSKLPNTKVNNMLYSTIARPTTGIQRTIWECQLRE